MSDPRTFIVIAAYNEAETVREVVRQVRERYASVVVVDDASTDATASRIEDLDVFLLRHVINRGQGASLQTGIRFALQRGAEIIVTFDADGQHEADDIATVLAPVRLRECDICLGSRFLGSASNIPWSRRLLLKCGVGFTRMVSRIEITDVHNGLRAMSRRAASSLELTMDRMAHASEILDQVKQSGLRYREVPVKILYSRRSLEKGQSSWNAVRIALQLFYKKLAQ